MATTRVFTNCQHTGYEPSDILIACGDGTAEVAGIHWEQWSTTSATGTGVLEVDDCQPDCATGHPVRTPGTVRLSGEADGSLGPVFSEVTVTPSSGGSTQRFSLSTSPV